MPKKPVKTKIIKGSLDSYFETGTEGVYWSLQEDGKTGYDGLVLLRPDLHIENMKIYYTKAIKWVKDKPVPDKTPKLVWEGKLDLITSFKAPSHPYFSQYIKQYPSGNGQQLSFGGMWVHHLPTNIDLGIWYKIFLNNNRDFIASLEVLDSPS